MAAPNLVNTSSVYGRSVGSSLGVTTAGIVTCATNKVLKINSVIVANVDGTSTADVKVDFYDSSKTTEYALAHEITVPVDSTLVVLGKDSPIYLEESDEIRGWASAAGDLEIIVSYEELDDA